MKVLMVGCGAVGQVLGLYLQKGGVELGFYARPESANRLEQVLVQGGLPLFQITRRRNQGPIIHRLRDYQVVTDIAGSQRFDPDQIWFTTPSTVFYSSWFQEFLGSVSSRRVVCFAPEGKRSEFIPDNEQEDRLVFGGITFISWQRDLQRGGGQADGVNFWLPPSAGIPLVGEEEACKEVAAPLKKGGLQASVKKKDFLDMQAALTALMSSFVVGFELAGWSLRAFRRSPWLKLAAHGAREGAMSQLTGAGSLIRALFGLITTKDIFYIVTLILPLLLPFDIERYLQFHYVKTREQTLNLLEVFASDGQKYKLPVGNIQLLHQGLLGCG